MAAETGTAPLEIGILGPVVATRGGQPIDLGGLQPRSILALLVLARGDALPADRLMDALWGENPTPSATSTLHSHISRLRGRLKSSESSVIVRQGTGYLLDVPRDAVDAWRFERMLSEVAGLPPAQRAAHLGSALALWRGPALVDHPDDDWALGEAARLDGLRQVARDQLLTARLDAGEHRVLVPELERLTSEDPLHEEYWRLLVLALYRSSRQADALAALRRAREVLADELGVDPGPALRQLEADVLAQSPDLEAPTEVSAPEPVQRVAATTSSDLLVDRDAELAQVHRCLQAAREGEGAFVVFEGPAGIGKTRLLAETRRLAAAEGFRVLEARGSAMEHEFGFGVVRQLLDPLLGDPGTSDLLDDLGGSVAAVFDRAEEPAAIDAYRQLQGLARLLAHGVGDRPALLSVDDLHEVDISSLRFLAFVLKRLSGARTVIAGTLRTGEQHPDERLLAEITGDPHTVQVRPRRLSAQASAELVRSRLGQDAAASFVDACHRATDGNPLLLLQVLRALETERVTPDASHAETVIAIGSRAIGSLVALRLKRLPDPATDVAKAVSVLGDRAELPVVAELVGVPEADVVGAVAALARAELLSDHYPLGFVHPLVAEAVYQSLAAGEQAALHERAAQLLQEAGHPAEQVAAHLLQAPRRGRPETVDLLVRAADQAQARGSGEAAVTFLRRALDEPPPPDDMVDLLVRTAVLAGSNDGLFARDALERAYSLCTDVEQRAEVALLLTSALVFVGTEGEAMSFALSAVDELPEDAVDARQGLVAMARVSAWIHDLPPERWMGEVEVAASGFGAKMLAVEQAFELSLQGVERRRMLRQLHEALDHPAWQTGAADVFYEIAGIALIIAGEDSTEHWSEAMIRAQARGETSTVGLHLWRGVALWLAGRLREAHQSLLSARYETEEWGSAAIGVPFCDALLVLVALDLGDRDGARDLLGRALASPGIGTGQRLLHLAHAAVLLADEDPTRALSVIDTYLPRLPGADNPGWDTARLLRADALVALGRDDEARVLLEGELERAERWGARVVTASVQRRIARIDRSPELARAAVDATAPRPLEQVRSFLVLADVTPDADERVASLQRALEVADRCRASRLRTEIADRLAGQGVAAAQPPTPRETVTELELRALALVESGTCRDDVARALFVAPRTVEVLVTGARQRLGVQHTEPLAQ